MPPKKKAEPKPAEEIVVEEVAATDVATEVSEPASGEQSLHGGLHAAFKGPRSADLNPAHT